MVSLDVKNLHLQGSFIIQYRNSTVQKAENTYRTEQVTVVDPEPPLFQLSAVNPKIIEVLFLQLIKELNINNIKILKKNLRREDNRGFRKLYVTH